MAVVSHRPRVEVTVDGRTVPAKSITISTGSPVDMHIPPSHGGVAGAAGTVEIAPQALVGEGVEAPWSPSFRATPGQEIECKIDGQRVFGGVVGPGTTSLRRRGGISLDLHDPMANTKATFSAMATDHRLPPRPGSTHEVPVGTSSLMYLDRALAAMGANSMVRVGGRTELHVGMVGTVNPYVGQIDLSTQTSGTSSVPAPYPDPVFVPMAGGRIGVKDPWLVYTTRAEHTGATVGSWHTTVEIDLAQITDNIWVRILGLGADDGFGIKLQSNRTMRVCTWDASSNRTEHNYVDQGQTLLDYPLETGERRVERLLFVYNLIDGYIDVRRAWSDGIADSGSQRWEIPVGDRPASMTRFDKQVRLRLNGMGVIGATSVMSRATGISANDNPYIGERRRVAYDLSAKRIAERSMLGHPPVDNENALDWVMDYVAKTRGMISTDDDGVVRISDPAEWRSKPVSHVIRDDNAGVDTFLNDVQVSTAIRETYSQVRVTGNTVITERAWGPGMKPNRLYASQNEQIIVRAGDRPQEFWLEVPNDGRFWIGKADLALRFAGEAARLPWHLPDDFARGRGSWGGGHIRDIVTGSIRRWAMSEEMGLQEDPPRPADIYYTVVQQVGSSAIKFVIEPGPGLGANEEYVNLPHPESISLSNDNPRRFLEYLPRFRGPGVGTVTDKGLEAVSNVDLTVNMIPNPSFETSLDTWQEHRAGVTLGRTQWAGSTSGGYTAYARNDSGAAIPSSSIITRMRDANNIACRPGQVWSFGAMVRGNAAAGSIRVRIHGFTASGTYVGTVTLAPNFPVDLTMRQLKIEGATIPPSVYRMQWQFLPGSSGAEVDATWWFDSIMAVRGPLLPPAFDGDTTNTPLYTYNWRGTPHNSPSERRVADWGVNAEYVHEGGLYVQSVEQAEELAQVIADSHRDDFGKATIECSLNTAVKIGQRIQVRPTSRSDVVLDGVVTDIPSRGVKTSSVPLMTLEMWVHRVTLNSITYDDRKALMEAAHRKDGAGRTYDADKARVGGQTYTAEKASALAQAQAGAHGPGDQTG